MGKAVPFLQLFLVLIMISLVTLGFDSMKVLSLPKQGMYALTNPISFGLYRFKQATFKQLSFMTFSRATARENTALREQLGQLLSENAGLRRQLAQTQALLDQQQSLDPKVYKMITARPIGSTRFLKIDRGLADGVKEQSAVVVKQNLLGQIAAVAEKTAAVRLITDPDSKVAVFSINKEGKAKGVLSGQFGSEMLMDKILHEEKIEVGDLVYSEGTEGFLPRGLIAGRVTEILARDNEVFKQARVEPLFDVRDLELVFILSE